jgi:uncharacterized membrane protein YsdA (DUF1294 family)
MQSSNATWTAALMLSGAALLSFLARTFVDYRFVYADLGFDVRTVGFSILIHLALLGGWIWALIAASHARRRGMYVLLGYNVLVAAFGIYTMTTLCPSPCRTGWPVGEITIWCNLLIGGTAALLAAMSVFRQPRIVPS